MLLGFSEPLVLKNFRVKFFLDTNILSYLIDSLYPYLDKVIELLQDKTEFIDIVSSKYVIFELIEVRKREAFRNEVFNKGGEINHYNTRIFNYPGITYNSLLPAIKQKVEGEISHIEDVLEISISGELHNSLLKPTIDTCLSSRLSREDSLVLTSSVLPLATISEENVVIMTNDKNFYDFYHESVSVSTVLSEHSLSIPSLCFIRRVRLDKGSELSLTNNNNTDDGVKSFMIEFLKENMIKSNGSIFVGLTNKKISTNNSKIIGFNFTGNASINEDSYLVIISKNLDFIKICPTRIAVFVNKSSNIEAFPITNVSSQLVFKWPDYDGVGFTEDEYNEMLIELKQSGNMVFVYPNF